MIRKNQVRTINRKKSAKLTKRTKKKKTVITGHLCLDENGKPKFIA